MEKHTTGPWFIEDNGKCIDITASEGSGCKGDRYMRVGGTIDIADARLIAAAPELLDALEPDREGADFLEWVANRLVFRYGEDENTDFIVCLRRRAEKSRAAIAKATGEK